MKNIAILLSVVFASFLPLASAEVWIPEDEFHGYFDSDAVYTVVGAVRNREDYSVLPTIEFVINEEGNLTTVIQQLPTVFANKDIPFKLKFPEITNQDVILEKPSVSFEKVDRPSSNVQIIYDKSLVKHKDGHLSGKIVNQGNTTEYDLKVYATIHGKNNKFLDVGKNNEQIDKIEPGQTLDFTIYPDPLIAPEVNYYSCFAIGDDTVIPVSAIRDGEKFNFRYDSTAAFTVVGFDDSGTTLSIAGINSFKVPAYVNFEFPKTSDVEQFDVLVNGEPAKFIQSVDEYGNWHVAFEVDGASQSEIIISGFEKPTSPLEGKAVEQPESAKPIAEKSTETNEKTDYVYYVAAALTAAIGAIFLYKYRSGRKLAA